MIRTARFSFAHLLQLLLAGACAACVAELAGAQESRSERPRGADGAALDEVVVTGAGDSYSVEDSASATKLRLSLRDTPQSMTVLTRQRLDDQNLQSLRDVLDNTAGVYSYQWDTERVTFTSRGFVVDSLLYDGVPAVTNVSTDSVDETLDTALYERIEIVRGATGLMSGAGSPAASVNLVRKHAIATELTIQTNVTAGSWEELRADIDVSTALTSSGNVRARVVGVYTDRESYQNLYSNEKHVLYGVIDADLGPNTLLSVGYDYQKYLPRGNTWGSFPMYLADGTPANWPRSVTTATNWSQWTKHKEAVFAEVRHELANGWTLRSSLTSRSADEDTRLFYVFGWPDPVTGNGLEPFAYHSDGTVDETLLDLYASGPFDLFGREHELVVGVNGSRVNSDDREFPHGDVAPTGNFFDWDGSYPQPEFATEGVPLTDIDTNQTSLYAAARLSLSDPLKLIAGARKGTWKIGHFTAPDVRFTHDHSMTIPYAGLIYDVSEEFSAFVSVTKIFNPQSSRDVNGVYLDPIEGRSVDFGIKGEHFGGRLNTALTLFDTRQDNVAEPVFDPETGEPIMLPDLSQASSPIDGTQTRGFEIEVSGELHQGWNASLGWSRHILEDSEGEAVRSFIPSTVLRLFTTWTPPGLTRLTVGGGINWQSDSDTLVGSPDGFVVLVQDDIALLSLMARYRFTPKISLQFNAENLTDERYYVLDDFDNTYFGAPANYSVGMNVRF